MKRIQEPLAMVDPQNIPFQEDLDELYPIDLPESMTEREMELYLGQVSEGRIEELKTLPTYKDDTKDIWEQERAQAEKEAKERVEFTKANSKVRLIQVYKKEKAQRMASQGESASYRQSQS